MFEIYVHIMVACIMQNYQKHQCCTRNIQKLVLEIIVFWECSSACHIAVSQIQKRKAVDVELYINDDKELFKSLFAHKDEIEKNMEMELEWKELPERKASRILIEKTVDLDDRATWPEQFDYIMDTCIKMKRAFKRYL